MRKFFNFMRHLQLINWKIIVYSIKELKCILRGGKETPSFDPATVQAYLDDLKNGREPKSLPMGAYEYSCCVEYLKKIRRALCSSYEDFGTMILVFDELDDWQTITPPIEDCLELVAEQVGFKVISEKIYFERYEYTLKCIF